MRQSSILSAKGARVHMTVKLFVFVIKGLFYVRVLLQYALYPERIIIVLDSGFSFLQHITKLIPNFYDDMDLIDDNSMPLPPLDDEDNFTDDNQKSTVVYSREVDSRSSNYSDPTKNITGKRAILNCIFHVYSVKEYLE